VDHALELGEQAEDDVVEALRRQDAVGLGDRLRERERGEVARGGEPQVCQHDHFADPHGGLR
jgi:hypothetical protein